ncbi:MAG: SDR family oxidoreductase [Wenzhouxiangella sp.]|jgi:NAD(P)-dependent dehydrogenase (short-subunit alcohol dehydrogenase family)|nr:SDR family oxidoreductase [Wenzhouxiangella sp.]
MTTALITGANRGIGFELARQLKAAGYDVIAVCRQSSADLDGLGVQIETGIDITDPKSLTELAGRLGKTTVDLLINNAGVLRASSLEGIEDQLDDFRLQFEVNSLAPLRVTNALLGHIKEGGKVVIITSRMGSIADNTSGGQYAYRMSKAAVNTAGVSLAHELKDRGIAVGLLHPGYVRTGMTRHTGHIDPDEAAANLIQRIEELSLDNTGSFRHANGEELPW